MKRKELTKTFIWLYKIFQRFNVDWHFTWFEIYLENIVVHDADLIVDLPVVTVVFTMKQNMRTEQNLFL